MNMIDFPLDLQTLYVKIRLPHNKDRTRIGTQYMEEGPIKNSVVVDQSFSMIDFHLRQPTIDVEYPMMVKNGVKQDPKPQWVIRIPIQRVFEHYVYHIIGIAFILSSFNFTVFLIDPEELSSRLSIVFTLFLTIIATKFLTIQSLPKMPYATFLDIYFHLTIVFFVLYVILVCIVAAVGKKHDAAAMNRCDVAFHAVLCAVWIAVNGHAALRGTKILRRHQQTHADKPVILQAGDTFRNHETRKSQ